MIPNSELNDMYNVISDLPFLVEDIDERFEEEAKQRGRDYYKNFKEKAEALLIEAKDYFFNYVVDNYEKHYPNTPISAEQIIKDFKELHGKLYFNADEVEKYLTEHYGEVADTLAYKFILTEAKKLLPYHSTGTTELKGKKINLRAWLRSDDYLGLTMEFDTRGRIYRFFQLISIVLDGQKPSTATTPSEYQMIDLPQHYEKDYKHFIEKQVIDGKFVKSIHLHKNDSFVVEFQTEEQAQKIAEALTGGKNEG